MFENYFIIEIFSTKCENSILLNTKIHFIFNFPNQMFQFLFFWSWIGPNKVRTLKKPWNYFEKPLSSSDLVWVASELLIAFINAALFNLDI